MQETPRARRSRNLLLRRYASTYAAVGAALLGKSSAALFPLVKTARLRRYVRRCPGRSKSQADMLQPSHAAARISLSQHCSLRQPQP